MTDNARLTTTTYLTPAEKDWLKQRAHDNLRSIAGELRQLVVEKMRADQNHEQGGVNDD